MTKLVVRLCLAALLLSGSIFVAACGNGGDNGNIANSGNTPSAASPGATTNSPASAAATPKPTGPAGYVDRADCEAIRGWVLNREHPDQPVSLEIYLDDKLQGNLKSDEFRQDLLDAKIGTGKYGFAYPIPANLKDGTSHAIRVKVQGTDYEPEFFRNTPHSISCMP